MSLEMIWVRSSYLLVTFMQIPKSADFPLCRFSPAASPIYADSPMLGFHYYVYLLRTDSRPEFTCAFHLLEEKDLEGIEESRRIGRNFILESPVQHPFLPC